MVSFSFANHSSAAPFAGKPFDVYNIASGDYSTVAEIADLAVEAAGLSPRAVRYEYTGGDRGRKGDVPVVRFVSPKSAPPAGRQDTALARRSNAPCLL